MRETCLLSLLLVSASCWGQGSYTLSLAKANSAFSLPAMTARGGILYEAHRSFDVLRFSNQLQVSMFDLATHKELKHTVIGVPRVHGARAAEGLYLSPDGQTLVYAELHEPHLLLVFSAKDLSEIRRTDALPFAAGDRYRLFAGFDEGGLLSFASVRSDMLRFVRMNLADFKISSEVTGPKQLNAEPVVWSPKSQTTWVQLPSGAWQEYHEDGSPSEAKLDFHFMHGADNGATVLGAGKLLAFYGDFSAQGAVVVYNNGHTGEVELKCVPHGYSSDNVPGYAGVICTTSPDREPERGGDRVLTSEFLLFKADGLATIAWRHPMDFLTVADSDEMGGGFQKGDPLLYRAGSKLLIVAPTKEPELAVYEVTLSE